MRKLGVSYKNITDKILRCLRRGSSFDRSLLKDRIIREDAENIIFSTITGIQPFSVAPRFFGEHIAVDVGSIIMFEILEEGFPIYWLSFVYNFGG
ncbi:MAG: hypothetical protein KAU06_00725 [Candidatus Marinimicrobia bacterium]|nr:hypothetical protein [Candidatus Neomarinimicrobiota bacterium]